MSAKSSNRVLLGQMHIGNNVEGHAPGEILSSSE